MKSFKFDMNDEMKRKQDTKVYFIDTCPELMYTVDRYFRLRNGKIILKNSVRE